MKTCRYFWLGCIALALLACGGGNAVEKRTPASISDGTKEIIQGVSFYRRGCYSKALDHFFRAHEYFASADHLSGVAMSLNNIGTVYRASGEANTALRVFKESYRIYKAIADSDGRGSNC